MTPDFLESLRFLRIIYPLGPWMLTAISVDKLKIESRTFVPEAPTGLDVVLASMIQDRDSLSDVETEIVAWLNLHRQRNLYYSVNEPVEKAREKTKLEKSDVRRVFHLHVDVDPHVGEDVQSEQERILRQLQTYAVPPSHIVFSGGGYNALWTLEEPVDVARDSPSPEETIRRAIDVERRNWQFELDFATPDHCRDVSRILRLPGTINRPDEKKIKKGRVPALARVIETSDRRYPLSRFIATPIVSSNQGSGENRVSENVRRVESLSDPALRDIPDKLKVVIAQGFDPDKEFSGDRSDTLFYVCCELVRCGVKDEVILGIITDSRFQISASVLDKGAGMRRYALRQIARARDKAVNPRLATMNERYAVIGNYGGRCMVMIERKKSAEDGTDQEYTPSSEYEFQRKGEFFDALDNEKIDFVDAKGKPKSIGVASWWFDQRRRRQYNHVVFEPGQDTPGDLNLWRGFAVEPINGVDHLRYLDHVYEVICDRNDENYDYLMRWMARCVQTPRTQSMVAPVLLSRERGTGKSTCCILFAKLFEPHSWVVDNPERLTGQFNAHLADRVLVVAEEAFDLQDRKHESVLKEMITGTTRAVEKKGVDLIRRPNYVHLMMTSNKDRVVPAGDYERRYLVLNVAIRRMQDSHYFRQIYRDFCVSDEIGAPLRQSGGGAHLLHHLMSLDLSGFDVTKVPHTSALREQQEYSLSTENEWLLQKLESGVWMSGREKWTGPVIKDELYRNYASYCKLIGVNRVNPYRVWQEWLIKTLGGRECVRTTQIMLSASERPYAFTFPGLDRCRQSYLDKRGWKNYEWPARLRSVEDVVEEAF